jgi:hypothetical protein
MSWVAKQAGLSAIRTSSSLASFGTKTLGNYAANKLASSGVISKEQAEQAKKGLKSSVNFVNKGVQQNVSSKNLSKAVNFTKDAYNNPTGTLQNVGNKALNKVQDPNFQNKALAVGSQVASQTAKLAQKGVSMAQQQYNNPVAVAQRSRGRSVRGGKYRKSRHHNKKSRKNKRKTSKKR